MAKALDILVADDESLNALALRSQLDALGHRVVGPARDGREAVEIARAHPVDLAILDIHMPHLSGLEVAREIVRIRPTPIIFLTGYSDPEFAAQAALAPIFHFLVKPVTLEDLTPAIGVARSRFEEWKKLKGEAESLVRKLEERDLVERAKAALIEARGLSEREAYRAIQKESQNRSLPMAEIARTILMADAVLRDSLAP